MNFKKMADTSFNLLPSHNVTFDDLKELKVLLVLSYVVSNQEKGMSL